MYVTYYSDCQRVTIFRIVPFTRCVVRWGAIWRPCPIIIRHFTINIYTLINYANICPNIINVLNLWKVQFIPRLWLFLLWSILK